MAREKERRAQAAKANSEAQTKPAEKETPGSTAQAAPEATNGETAKTHTPPKEAKEARKSDDPPTPSRGRDPKGKRKVTFDVEPEVVVIKTETEGGVASTETPTQERDPKGMFFSRLCRNEWF